jgi:large subunit ribosomal protein L4
MKQAVYDTKGKEVKKVDLPKEIFDLPWNADLVHQVIVSMQSNLRTPVAHTKDRSEVRGGGRKPWRQKGTGRARHGSRRSPIWAGGGVTFGPRNERNFDKKINKKMKVKALNTILSQKLRDGEVLLVDSISFEEPKTKEAKVIVNSLAKVKGYEDLATKRKNAAYIATDENDKNARKSFSNFGNIKLDEVRNINPVDLMNYKYVIIENPDVSLDSLKNNGTFFGNKKRKSRKERC